MTGQDMRCAVRVRPRLIETQTRPVPAVGAGQVLIHMRRIGICGGDLHRYRGDDRVRIIGHEMAGTIVEVAPGITDFVPGTRVVVEPLRGCGRCEHCLGGRPHVCAERRVMGYEVDGGCAEYVAISADQCLPIPDGLSWEQAANVHGLAAPIQALSKVHYRIGDTVAIIGAGPQALFFTQIARRCMGASLVIVAGRSSRRLEVARQLGADHVIDTHDDPLVESVLGLTGGQGANLVIDTSGNPAAQVSMVQIAKKGGHVVPYSPGSAMMDFREILLKEVTLYGSTGVTGCMPRAISLLERGLVEIEPIMSHWFRLEEAQHAFEMATADDKGDYIKGGLIVSDD